MDSRAVPAAAGRTAEMAVRRYAPVAMLLHWLVAALVVYLFWLGFNMVDIPKGPARGAAFGLHKSLGLLVLSLMVARLAWRLRHAPPPLPPTLPRWQVGLSKGVHHGFYALLFLHPLFGYLSAEFAGYGTKFFGVPLYNWGWKDQAINEFFTECHEVTGVVLLLLVLVHLAGAISHALRRGDHVVRRMLPW